MALNTLQKLIFVLLLLKLARSKERLVNSEASIDQSLEDLKAFCSNKNSIDFCSPDHLSMAMDFLHRQRVIIRENMEKKEREERKAQRIRKKNRINGEKMIWALREHFLDRHF
jgi:hypothetical protein